MKKRFFFSAVAAAVLGAFAAGCAGAQVKSDNPGAVEDSPAPVETTVPAPAVQAEPVQAVESVPVQESSAPLDTSREVAITPASREAIDFYRRGKYLEGIRPLEAAVAAGTANGLDYFNLAVGQRAVGLVQQAFDNASKSVSRVPDARKALALYLELAKELNRRTEPRELLEPLYEKNPGSLNLGLAVAEAMMLAGRGMDALRLCTDLLKKDETNTAIMIAMARAYLSMNKPDAARFILLQAVRIKEEPDVYDILGKLEMAEGNSRKAIELFARAIELDATLSGARNNLGLLYTGAGDYDGAIEQLSSSVSQDPRSWQAQMNLGNAFRKKRMFAEAFDAYDKAIKINPNCAECYFNMGVAEIENIPADGQDTSDHYRRGAEFLRRYKAMVRVGGGTADTADKYIDEAVRMAEFVDQQGALMKSQAEKAAAEKAAAEKAAAEKAPEQNAGDRPEEGAVDQAPAGSDKGSKKAPAEDEGWDFE